MSEFVYKHLGTIKDKSIGKLDTKVSRCGPPFLGLPHGPIIAHFNQITCLHDIRSKKSITQAEVKGYPCRSSKCHHLQE